MNKTSSTPGRRSPDNVRTGVVVIGRNEGERLSRSLRALVNLRERTVYVDSGSTDGSLDRARNLGFDALSLEPSRPFSAARARNEGRDWLSKRFPGLAYVQFVDGDSVLDPDWLAAAEAEMDADPELVALAGVLRERDPDASRFRRLCHQEWSVPAGPSHDVGGNAFLRLEAFDAVGGFTPGLGAGEEPELCLRLRRRGGKILRIDAHMAEHDSGDGGFRTWWNRAVRSGGASAMAVALHGIRDARADLRRSASAALWGALLPAGWCCVLALVWTSRFDHPWLATAALSLLFVSAYAVLFGRIVRYRRSQGDRPPDARGYALFAIVAKVAGVLGIARFLRQGGVARARAQSSSLAVLSARFPLRSETFVYREVRALRKRGWRVCTVSLRSGGSEAPKSSDDLTRGHLALYESGWASLMGAAVGNCLLHPWRALLVAAACARDVTAPGEETSLKTRSKLLVQAFAGVALARWLRRERVGHVHCHFAHAPATVGMYAAMHANLPFSFTGHANDIFVNRAVLGRKLDRAAFVSCISEWHRDFYAEIRPGAAARLVVQRCGVDVDHWAPQTKTRNATEPALLLTVCRLVENKGVDVLIRALALAAKGQPPKWTLTVAGDGPLRAELSQLARQEGVADRVRFLGSVENEDVHDLMRRASAFALGCKFDSQGDRDGVPVVLMEAMACGLPVLSGDLPALRELVEDGVTGLLFDPSRPEMLSALLGRIAAEPDWARSLAQRGRERVTREFSLATNVSRLEASLRGQRTNP